MSLAALIGSHEAYFPPQYDLLYSSTISVTTARTQYALSKSLSFIRASMLPSIYVCFIITMIFLLSLPRTSVALPKMQKQDRINFSDYYDMSAYSLCIYALLGNQDNNYLSRSMGRTANLCLCYNLSTAYDWADWHMRKNTNCADENESKKARKLLDQYCAQVMKSSDGTARTTTSAKKPTPTSSSK